MSMTAATAGELDIATTEQQVIRKIAWRLMPLIIVCYFFAFFDRVNISFAKAALQADLGLSNTAYGFGASLFVVGYVLLEVPSNLLLYRFGARRWIARIMISWGIATAGMVFVKSEWQFYGLRFVIGAMEAGFAPGILYYLTLWFPKSHSGRLRLGASPPLPNPGPRSSLWRDLCPPGSVDRHSRSSDVFPLTLAERLCRTADRVGPEGMHRPCRSPRRTLSAPPSHVVQTRTHLSLNKDAPVPRGVEWAGNIVCRPILGGLHHQYGRM